MCWMESFCPKNLPGQLNLTLQWKALHQVWWIFPLLNKPNNPKLHPDKNISLFHSLEYDTYKIAFIYETFVKIHTQHAAGIITKHSLPWQTNSLPDPARECIFQKPKYNFGWGSYYFQFWIWIKMYSQIEYNFAFII